MANTAKVEAKTVLPDTARPAAVPIRFCSAMPTLKNRSGNFLANSTVRVDEDRSPSSTTTSVRDLADLHQRVGVLLPLAGVDPLHMLSPSSLRAMRYSSALGALPWKAMAPSMNETPFPLMVWAMIMVGLPDDLGGLLAGLQDLPHVVPVDLDDVPAEGPPLVPEGLQGHDLLGGAVDLHLVAVDERGDVVQLVMGGQHGRFPVLALLQLPVPQQAEDAGQAAVQLGGQGHAVGDAQSLAQRTGGDLHARGLHPAGVSLQVGAQLAQGQQVVHREVPGLGQSGVVRRSGVALGQHELVAVLPRGVLGAVLHDLEEKGGYDIGVREGPARMTGLRREGHLDDVAPDQVRLGLQHLNGLVIV